MNEDDELGFIFKMEINQLASSFYIMMGKSAGDNFDFSASTHPEEFGCWNMAVVAYAFIRKDNDLLKHQVTNSISNLF